MRSDEKAYCVAHTPRKSATAPTTNGAAHRFSTLAGAPSLERLPNSRPRTTARSAPEAGNIKSSRKNSVILASDLG